jgi:hypothetical protein
VAQELVTPGHPPAGETAAQEQAVEKEGVTQKVAVLRDVAENTKITTPLSKRAQVSPAQEVSLLDADQTKAEGSSSRDHDASVDQFINVLLNVDHATQKFMIIKLVSNIDLRRSIKEVLSAIPIISQSTLNNSVVNWEECTPPYAVDKRAFQNHTRGKNKGLPRDSDPNICTNGEYCALEKSTQRFRWYWHVRATATDSLTSTIRSILPKHIVIHWYQHEGD